MDQDQKYLTSKKRDRRSGLVFLSFTRHSDELLGLITDIASDGALSMRLESMNGSLTPVWFTDCGWRFADHIFPMEDALNALRAELFLDGDLVFTIERAPKVHLWWRTVKSLETTAVMKPN